MTYPRFGIMTRTMNTNVDFGRALYYTYVRAYMHTDVHTSRYKYRYAYLSAYIGWDT